MSYYIYFAFLIFFSIGLFIANIICFKKKTYLYLFFVMYLFLPEYYGIEFSESLPILTVTRMMFIVFYIYSFINRRRNLKLSIAEIKNLPKEYYFLGGYFVLRIISNLYYVFTYTQAIKTIFEIVFEQLFLLIAIWLLSPTKEEINKLIKVIVYAASIMFVLGIVESFSGIRIFDALYTIDRYVLNSHYIRLGLLRSTVTMGLSNYYGNMCVIMIPFIIYIYELEKSFKYILIIILDIFAIIHSGCRADIFFLFIIAITYFICICKGKEKRIQFFRNAGLITVAITVLITVLSISSPYYKYFYVGTGKSLLNEVGFNFDLDEGAPSDVNGYGANSGDVTGTGGIGSRKTQLSGIIYATKVNFLFGLGSGAQNRGEVHYMWGGHWCSFSTYDLGYVEVYCDEGLVGAIGYAFLFLSFMSFAQKDDSTQVRERIHLMVFSYLLCQLSSTNMTEFLIPIILVSLYEKPLLQTATLIVKGNA